MYVALKMPEEWARTGLDFTDAEQARFGLLKFFEDWSPDLTEMLRVCEDTFQP